MASSESVRISSLESRIRITRLLSSLIVVVNLLGIACSAYLFYSLHYTLDERSGTNLLNDIRRDFRAYEEIEQESRDELSLVRDLESSLDLKQSEIKIIATADQMYENERQFQIFFRLLKVNMYHLTAEFPGSNSWYEIYGPRVDDAIERSRSRQLQLLQIKKYYHDAA